MTTSPRPGQGAAAAAHGLLDVVLGAQHAFRMALQALSRPGRVVELQAPLVPPDGMGLAMAALALTLADYETPIWMDEQLSADENVSGYVRFHTGARLVCEPDKSAFALISDSVRMPALARFGQGTPEYPDRSTTLVIEVQSLEEGAWLLTGPGIETSRTFSAAPLPPDFLDQLSRNHASFPCGVDVLLTSGSRLAALPRSTRIAERQ